MTCPCRGCEERTETCHAECEKYLAFREFCEQQRKERGRYANVRDYFGQRKVKTARVFKRYRTNKDDG